MVLLHRGLAALILALCILPLGSGILFDDDGNCRFFKGFCQSLFGAKDNKGTKVSFLVPELCHPTSSGLVKGAPQNMTINMEPKSCPLLETDSRYRTVDGTCNNPFNLGSAPRQLGRVLSPKYHDGRGAPRKVGKNGKLLPGPRTISKVIHPDVKSVTSFTIFVMQWGQLMDHDLVSTPLPIEETRKTIKCCSEDRTHALPDANPECFPIMFRKEDNFVGNCMEFVRSMPVMDSFGNTQEPREHMNAVTSFLDASVVYGSGEERLKRVRSNSGKGYLLALTEEDLFIDNEMEDCIKENPGDYCFLAGDDRVNEHAALALIHLVLARLHNRFAHMLRYMRPMYSDEEVFQRARHINVAIMQKIMYSDWLPILLGPETIKRKGLKVGPGVPRPEYSSFVDPTIPSSFGAAVFRFGHTLIPRSLPFGNTRVLLRDLFFRPMKLKGNVDVLAEGLTSALDNEDRSQMPDAFIVEEVTNHLFETEEGVGKGFDLISLNIQRARDHGIPPYNDFREHCGLKRIESFSDRALGISQKAMAAVYDHPDDIDLFSGSIVETPIGGGLVGETFNCLMSNVFHNLKYGDRFFYETKGQKGSFTDDELNEIRKVTLSQVLCQTTGIKEVQLNVFRLPSKTNPKVSCDWLVRQGIHVDVFVHNW